MADRSCPVCDAHVSAGDRFCAACGVRLDAPVVLDGGNPPPTATTEHVRSGGRLSALLVPLLVLGVLALGALVLFGGGDTDPADTTNDTLADPSPSPSAETEPTPGSPAPTATPRPTPTTTPTPVDVDEVLDVSALPPTEATHLAVLKGNDVGFLNLRTGEWVIREVFDRLAPSETTPWAFGRGIVTNAGGFVVYVPVDAEPTTLRQGWAIGAASDRVWINEVGDQGTQVVVAVDPDGEVVDQFTAPPMTWVESVLPTGELVIRGGGQLFIRSDSAIRAATNGELFGRIGSQALLQRCDDELNCGFVVVDLTTGDTTAIELDISGGAYPQLARGGVVMYGRQNAAFYRIEDATVIFDRDLTHEEAEALLWGAVTRTTAPEGVTASVENSILRFEDESDDILTEGSIDVLSGFGQPSVLFITVPDTT